MIWTQLALMLVRLHLGSHDQSNDALLTHVSMVSNIVYPYECQMTLMSMTAFAVNIPSTMLDVPHSEPMLCYWPATGPLSPHQTRHATLITSTRKNYCH